MSELHKNDNISRKVWSDAYGVILDADDMLQSGKRTRQVCVSVVIPFILDVRLVDAPAGVTQEDGHTGFSHLPSAVLALFFFARRIQPFLSLVDCEVEFCKPTN